MKVNVFVSLVVIHMPVTTGACGETGWGMGGGGWGVPLVFKDKFRFMYVCVRFEYTEE